MSIAPARKRPAWTAHYPAGVSADLVASVPTMLEAWTRTVAARPDAHAVHYLGRTLTFAEIDSASDALAVAFADGGVGRGDRVALYLQNDPQWLISLIAAWKCGAAAACLNPMLRAAELRHQVDDAAPAALICLDTLYAEVVAPIRPDLNVPIVITTSARDLAGEPPEPFAAAWGERRRFADTLDWLDLMDAHAGRVPRAPVLGPDDLALLTYTSGTTGGAKGAMNTHGAMAHSAEVYRAWFALDPDRDVVLGVAPLFHITGSVAGLGVTILSGAPIVLLHRFDAALVLAAIERHRATFAVLASTAYNALSAHPDATVRDLSSLTTPLCGGAPLGRALIERVRDRTGWELRGVYGLTESTSPATICPPALRPPVDPESGAASVGVPVPGADLRIVGSDGETELPPGTVGEIKISGPMVIPGYWNLPGETATAISNGRLRTGDVGMLDEAGWLYVVDRTKDLINAGGYKVWPREVEDLLASHPAVGECAVVGVPDDYRGETVKAVVSLRPGFTATPGELIDFARARIAAYKYPRIVEIVDELPKNASGKILRRHLRDESEGSA